MDGQERFQHRLPFVRGANAGRGLVIRCAHAGALRCWFSTHTIVHTFWLPLFLSIPLAAVQFRCDILKQSRALVAELCGATAISAVAAMIVQTAG